MLYPDVVGRCPFPALVARIANSPRLQQQKLHFGGGKKLVLDAFGHDEHLPRLDGDGAVPKDDAQVSVEDQEGLVGVLVAVPDKIALNTDQLELVVVQLGDDAGLPLVADEG